MLFFKCVCYDDKGTQLRQVYIIAIIVGKCNKYLKSNFAFTNVEYRFIIKLTLQIINKELSSRQGDVLRIPYRRYSPQALWHDLV